MHGTVGDAPGDVAVDGVDARFERAAVRAGRQRAARRAGRRLLSAAAAKYTILTASHSVRCREELSAGGVRVCVNWWAGAWTVGG